MFCDNGNKYIELLPPAFDQHFYNRITKYIFVSTKFPLIIPELVIDENLVKLNQLLVQILFRFPWKLLSRVLSAIVTYRSNQTSHVVVINPCPFIGIFSVDVIEADQ